jgi:hypothetical protein
MKLEQKLFDVSSLDNLSVSALYSGDVPIYTPNGVISSSQLGESSFQVSLPSSNAVDKEIKISTPELGLFINSYQRIIGKSGVDYFNLDGSIAGRLTGLNKSEVDYLKDTDE